MWENKEREEWRLSSCDDNDDQISHGDQIGVSLRADLNFDDEQI